MQKWFITIIQMRDEYSPKNQKKTSVETVVNKNLWIWSQKLGRAKKASMGNKWHTGTEISKTHQGNACLHRDSDCSRVPLKLHPSRWCRWAARLQNNASVEGICSVRKTEQQTLTDKTRPTLEQTIWNGLDYFWASYDMN